MSMPADIHTDDPETAKVLAASHIAWSTAGAIPTEPSQKIELYIQFFDRAYKGMHETTGELYSSVGHTG